MSTGRWTQYDEDEYRLPEGMKRIGYDSDTQRYTFQDKDGSIWQGEAGAAYGEMTKVSEGRGISSAAAEDDDLEAGDVPARADGYRPLATGMGADSRHSFPRGSAYRPLLPFFLIIAVLFLFLWRFVFYPSMGSSYPQHPPSTPGRLACSGGMVAHTVKHGDTCWDIAQAYHCSLDKLREINARIDCDKLQPGNILCLPKEGGGV